MSSERSLLARRACAAAIGAAVAFAGIRTRASPPVAAAPPEVRVTTAHYSIVGDVEREAAEEYGKVLEAAWPQFEAFHERAPRLERDAKLKVSLHADLASMQSAIRVAGGMQEDSSTPMHFCWVSETVYLHARPERWATRAQLLRMASFQFQWLANATGKGRKGDPIQWWFQGAALHLAHHTWDGEKLRLGVVPLATSWDDPAEAAETAGRPGFSWDAIAEADETSACAMHFVRWLATANGGKPARGFETLRSELERGVDMTRKSILKATGLDAPALNAKIGKWLPTVQQPMATENAGWDVTGDRSLRGGSDGYIHVRTRNRAATFSASFRPRDPTTWNAGLILRWASGEDYTMAMVSSEAGVRVSTWTGRWTDLANVPVGAKPPAEGPDSGWWKIHAARGKDGVTVTLNGATVGTWPVADGPLGLTLYRSDVEFRDIAWTE